MKRCNNCGYTTQDNSMIYCEECGQALVDVSVNIQKQQTAKPPVQLSLSAPICPQCGESVDSDYHYCSYCGYDLDHYRANIGDWKFAHMTLWGKFVSVFNVFLAIFLLFQIFLVLFAIVFNAIFGKMLH
jgi:uncharacterized membrane protein YvbJ